MKKYLSLRGLPHGFTLTELLVVVVIIGVLASLSFVAFVGIRGKARDTKRKADLATVGRFLTISCYLPTAGAGVYDIADIIAELKATDEKYKQAAIINFRDPKSGTAEHSNYFYLVDANKKCALFANLESADEPITLKDINTATAGGGSGSFASSTKGLNGSLNYYQVSN